MKLYFLIIINLFISITISSGQNLVANPELNLYLSGVIEECPGLSRFSVYNYALDQSRTQGWRASHGDSRMTFCPIITKCCSSSCSNVESYFIDEFSGLLTTGMQPNGQQIETTSGMFTGIPTVDPNEFYSLSFQLSPSYKGHGTSITEFGVYATSGLVNSNQLSIPQPVNKLLLYKESNISTSDLQSIRSVRINNIKNTTGLLLDQLWFYIIDLNGCQQILWLDNVEWRKGSCCLQDASYTVNHFIPGNTRVKNNINTSGNVVLQPERIVTFKAGNIIDLASGFTVENGAHFEAMIESCSGQTCGSSESTNRKSYYHEKSVSYKIYPNPTVGTVTITGDHVFDKIHVLNSYGDKVYEFNKDAMECTIDLSEFPSGVYFIKLKNGDNFLTERVTLIR
ncbi:MAG: T9SS type A sorting domain-containing protein [Cytophagaceae bacterium]